MEITVFVISAAIVLTGALGVILARNTVHSALFLVQTLFGVAVLFVLQEAHFLAAVQVIVYAGAIVILFLFVIMLLGVDQVEDLRVEPITGLRPVAAVLGAAIIAFGLVVVLIGTDAITGARSVTGALDQEGRADIAVLGDHLFTDYVLAFEITAALLTIAVVGAVVLVRRPRGDVDADPARPDEGGSG